MDIARLASCQHLRTPMIPNQSFVITRYDRNAPCRNDPLTEVVGIIWILTAVRIRTAAENLRRFDVVYLHRRLDILFL